MKPIPLLFRGFLVQFTIALCGGVQAADSVSPLPKVSHGVVRRLQAFPSKYIAERTVDIWVPDGLDPKKRYPVIYMQDGQALFDPSLNWSHQEWRVDETVSLMVARGEIPPIIIVGIWNNGYGRFAEYFPQKVWLTLVERHGLQLATQVVPKFPADIPSPRFCADLYLRFIVEELKPFIDQNLPTASDPANTFIAGSSMGGLISLYGLCEYPEIFGGAACLSTHWTGTLQQQIEDIPESMLIYLKAHLPKPKGHRIYFDHGTVGFDVGYGRYQVRADEIFKMAGFGETNFMSLVFPGDDHSETTWANRLQIPLRFLLMGEKASSTAPEYSGKR